MSKSYPRIQKHIKLSTSLLNLNSVQRCISQNWICHLNINPWHCTGNAWWKFCLFVSLSGQDSQAHQCPLSCRALSCILSWVLLGLGLKAEELHVWSCSSSTSPFWWNSRIFEPLLFWFSQWSNWIPSVKSSWSYLYFGFTCNSALKKSCDGLLTFGMWMKTGYPVPFV